MKHLVYSILNEVGKTKFSLGICLVYDLNSQTDRNFMFSNLNTHTPLIFPVSNQLPFPMGIALGVVGEGRKVSVVRKLCKYRKTECMMQIGSCYSGVE